MNKSEFTAVLKRALGGMPEKEKKEILFDYEEHFRIGTESGKTEEEIAKALGNPRNLGKSYRIEAMLEEGRAEGSAATVLRAVFASLSLGFLNLVVVLGPFIALVAVIVAMWAAAGTLALSGLAVILGLIAQPFLPQYIAVGGLSIPFLVFASIGASALGLLAVIGMWYLSRWFVFAVARYVELNVRIVTNRR